MFVSAIIPAYNEENTIAAVIDVLKKVKIVDEIVVVSDGSTDKTAVIAGQYGTKVIELSRNMGKGAAVKAGLEACKGDVVVFLDADLVGLKESHIVCLLNPVLNDEADMTVGLFSNGRLSTDLAQKISPYLSGQRAVRKRIIDGISDLQMTGYGMEIAMTIYAGRNNVRVRDVELSDLTHVMKEEKLGFAKGFSQRLKMYWQIYKGIKLARR